MAFRALWTILEVARNIICHRRTWLMPLKYEQSRTLQLRSKNIPTFLDVTLLEHRPSVRLDFFAITISVLRVVVLWWGYIVIKLNAILK